MRVGAEWVLLTAIRLNGSKCYVVYLFPSTNVPNSNPLFGQKLLNHTLILIDRTSVSVAAVHVLSCTRTSVDPCVSLLPQWRGAR
jgi:hypothetical protein